MTLIVDSEVILLRNYLFLFLLYPIVAILILSGFYGNGTILPYPHVSHELMKQAFLSSLSSAEGSQHSISATWSGVSSVFNYGVDFLLLY